MGRQEEKWETQGEECVYVCVCLWGIKGQEKVPRRNQVFGIT